MKSFRNRKNGSHRPWDNIRIWKVSSTFLNFLSPELCLYLGSLKHTSRSSATLCNITVCHDIYPPTLSVRSRVSASKYTADRESGDSVGEAYSTSQAGLCNPLGVRGTAPPPSSTALPHVPPQPKRRDVLTPTHPSNTLHISNTFLLCRGTSLCCLPLETLPHLLTPLPPWQSLSSSLPPRPQLS